MCVIRASFLAAMALVAFATFPPSRALAQDPTGWIGKRVVLQFDSVLNDGKGGIDNQKRKSRSRGGLRITHRVYRVEHVNGPWIWLQAETEGAAGWIQAAEVIPFDQAIDYYTAQIRANSADSNAYTSRGHLWKDRKEFDIAIADYNEAIRLDPGSEVGWYCRGIAWGNKKEYEKAIVDFGEAIRLDPKYALAYNNRGIAWGNKKEYDKAITDYSEAIRLDPKYALAYNNRGIAWGNKKEYDKAITDYSEAIRLDPKYALAYNNRGIAWGNKKEYDKAITDYSEAIRLDPKYALAYNGRAWLWATCPDAKYRDGKRAIESATKACELGDWKVANDIDTLGAAYAEAGDFATAVEWQTKAIALVTDEKKKDDFRNRLKLYEAKTPYRDVPTTPSPDPK